MNIARTDSRERGAPYNQHHGSKNHRDNPSRDQPTPDAEDAIDISLSALIAAAEVDPLSAPKVAGVVDPALVEGAELPHIDIKV